MSESDWRRGFKAGWTTILNRAIEALGGDKPAEVLCELVEGKIALLNLLHDIDPSPAYTADWHLQDLVHTLRKEIGK